MKRLETAHSTSWCVAPWQRPVLLMRLLPLLLRLVPWQLLAKVLWTGMFDLSAGYGSFITREMMHGTTRTTPECTMLSDRIGTRLFQRPWQRQGPRRVLRDWQKPRRQLQKLHRERASSTACR